MRFGIAAEPVQVFGADTTKKFAGMSTCGDSVMTRDVEVNKNKETCIKNMYTPIQVGGVIPQVAVGSSVHSNLYKRY